MGRARSAGWYQDAIYYLESEPEDHPAVLAYWERGEGISLWDPEPEPGWWLIEIGDSEDGPYAVYATHACGVSARCHIAKWLVL